MSDKAANKKQDKVYTLLGGLVVAGLLIWLGFAMFGGSKNETANDAASELGTSSETTKSDLIENTGLTKSAVEETCEDTKYGVADGYNVIVMSNYDFQVYDTGLYDKDKNPIVQAMWNGKRESDEAIVKYWCYVSGVSDDSITVHYISVGDSADREDVWKSQTDLDYNSYNSDGSPAYPDLH